jgi:hypothetical protein
MTQSMAGQPGEKLPAVAYKLGGTPLSIHHGRNTARWLNVISFLVVAAFTGLGGTYLIATGQKPGVGFLGIPFGLGCLLYGLYEGYRTIIERDLCVIVMRDGFVLSRGDQDSVFRWGDIVAVWEAITEARQNGIKLKTIYRYTVQQRDGQKIVLTDTLEDIEKLGSTIQKEVTQRLLSQAHDALNAGQTLDFGKVGVSRSGIIISKKTTPWNHIKNVDVNDGFIAISRDGKPLNWVAKVGDIPNVYVFLTLVNQALGVKSQNTAQSASTGMVLECANAQPIQNATESDIARLFGDDRARGDFVILSHSKQYYVQAAGEGNGPYTLECRAGDKENHFRCTQSLGKHAVQVALLKYLRHDSSFTTDFVWEKVKF